MDKSNIEKSLKRFLKRKVSYTLATLVTFMITGGIAYADTASDILTMREGMNSKIETLKSVIQKKIAENDKEIAKYEKSIYSLIEKGDFYSKPNFESTQGFIFHNNYNTKELKDNTSEAWAHDLALIAKVDKEQADKAEQNATEQSSTRTYAQTLGDKKLNPLEQLWAGNGTVVGDETANDTIKLGANIVLKNPDIPHIDVKVEANADAPVISLGELPGEIRVDSPKVKDVTVPTLNLNTSVPTISVNVNAPGEVAKIDVAIPKVEAPKPSVPDVPTVEAPTTPAGFVPKQIVSPATPEVVLPKITAPGKIDGLNFFGYIDSNYVWWKSSDDYVAMYQMSLTKGKIKAIGYKGAYFDNVEGMSGLDTSLGRQSPSGSITNGELNKSSAPMFYGAVNSAFMQWGPEVEISWFPDDKISGRGYNYTQLIYQETKNNTSQSLNTIGGTEEARAKTGMSKKTYEELKKYIEQTKLDSADHGNTLIHNQQGKIFLANKNSRYLGSTTNGNGKLSIWNNEGTITGMNYDNIHSGSGAEAQIVFYNTPDTTTNHNQRWIYGNSEKGIINMYAPKSIVMNYASNGDKQRYVGMGFVNNGEINLYGIDSTGVMPNPGETLNNRSGWYLNKPINVYADGARGIYIPANISSLDSSHAITRVHIGYDKNKTEDFIWHDIETDKDISIAPNGNMTGKSTDTVDSAVGIMYSNSNNAKMEAPDITLEKFAKDSLGIYVNAGSLDVKNGQINLKGGDNNAGIYLKGGNLTYTGNINIEKSTLEKVGGKEDAKVLAAYVDGQTLTMTGNINAKNKDTTTLYVTNSGKIGITGDVNITSTGENVVGAYAENATITMNRGSVPAISNINITGDNKTGLVFYANAGGQIVAKNQNINVVNGSTVVASTGTNSKVDLTGSKINYDGAGYAIYAHDKGEINLSDVELHLGGKSTAWDLIGSKATAEDKGKAGKVITNPNTRIVVDSNDVVVFNLIGADKLDTDNLSETINNEVTGSARGTQIWQDGKDKDGKITDKYIVAAVDGGTLKVGNLDKAGISTDTAQTKKDGYFYYRRFLGQRLNATITDGSTVQAILDSKYAKEYFHNQVAAFEMNSSSKATDNTEAQINIGSGAKVIADRIDAGAGAVGLYIDYGLVNVNNGATVSVEKEANTINGGAVGVYAVNGSVVTNAGEITVGGDSSIGLLGLGNRQDTDGNAIANEFGGKNGEGTISLTNSGTLTLDGTGSIGIYAKNNSGKAVSDIKAINDNGATLTVGNKGFGMLGDKATITNSGKITTGESGISIYATNGTQVAKVGNIALNNKAIGVMLDGSSTITDTNDLVFTSSVANGKEQTAIYLTGDNTISNNIDISGLTGGIGIFAHNANMEYVSGKTITVGESGIGIYLDGAGKTATNKGIIKPANGKNNSIGMFTKSGTAVNDGTIVIAGDNQVAMYGESENAHIKNTGFIDFEKDNTTGIYIKDGATATYGAGSQAGAPLLRFNNGVKQIGIFAENAKIKVEDCMEFRSRNKKENIFVYANKGSELVVNSGVNMEVTGVIIPTAEADKDKKSIGAYLDAKDKENAFTNNGTLKVTVGAIGVYSKGNNTISNENVEVTGDKTTGIFLDGGASLKGANNFKLADKAVGVYATSGKVNLESAVNINVATNEGAGFYLIDGAALEGQKIVFTNSGADHSIAAYYDKGTNANEVINKTDIELAGSKAAVGIYAANGINLTNESNISGATGKDIAVYVAGNSNYKGSGDIVMAGNDSLGIFVGEGSATNSGTIDVSGSSATAGTGAVAGMLASSAAGKSAEAINTGTIKIGTGDSKIGMYISGTGNNKGVNKGTIDNSDALGVYVEGARNSFDGTNGEIKTKTGIYLKDTVAKAVTNIGKLSIKQDGVGVVAENSVVDFDIKTGNETTGLYAKGTSKISNNNVEVGDGSVGIYLENANTIDGITVKTGATIGTGAAAKTSVGIVAKGAGTYNIDAKDINANNGIGIYLDNTQTRTLNFDGNLTTKGGIGFYIDQNNTLNTGVAKDTTITVEGGTGIYAKGTANIGTGSKKTNFNFKENNSIGVYSDGGIVNFGTNAETEGKGTLVATKDGDLTVTGSKINVTDGAVGLLGTYGNGTTSAKTIAFNGDTINTTNGAIGIAAVKGNSNPTGIVSIINGGKISASGKHAIGIYSDVAKIENTNTITVGNDGIGIYADATGKDISNTGDIKLTGENGIGLYVSKNAGTINSGKITGVNDTKSVGLLLSEVAHDVDIDNISLGDGSIGVVTTGDNSAERRLNLKGEIKVGNSITGNGAKSSIGIVANKGSKIKVDTSNANAKITVGEKGIGVYVVDNGSSIETVLDKIKVGKDGILAMAVNGSKLVAKGNGNAVVVDGGTGVIAKDANVTLNNVDLEVKTGGTGVYVDGNVLPTITGGNIKVNSGTEEKKSIGAYYANITNLHNIVPVQQVGDNTIGTVLDKATGVNYSQDVTTNGNGNIGFILKNGSDIIAQGITMGDGDKNIGIYAENSKVTTNGDIKVGKSNVDSAVGVYVKKGEYKGTGNIDVKENSIGIYVENIENKTIEQVGDIKVGDKALGIYGQGTGTIKANSVVAANDKSLGIYSKGMDINVSGNVVAGNNGSTAIISDGNGSVSIGSLGNIGKNSIGIYKKDGATPSNITIAGGNSTIGDGGYGILVTNSKDITVSNRSNMVLGKSAVGIYLDGKGNTLNNSGNITVGETDTMGDCGDVKKHKNSIGIYLTGGAKGENTGIITAAHHHSIGTYVSGKGSEFVNTGTYNVDKGGIGLYADGGAKIINTGTINLGSNPTGVVNCEVDSVGMAGFGKGSEVNNKGTINVHGGVGMVIGAGVKVFNSGRIVVDSGHLGIQGGHLDENELNNIVGSGQKFESLGQQELSLGSISIDNKGNISTGRDYVSLGGSLVTDGTVNINNSFFDVSVKGENGESIKAIVASRVTGNINVLSNFAAKQNGVHYVFKNVISTVQDNMTKTTFNLSTSPLFVAKLVKTPNVEKNLEIGDIVAYKVPYIDLTAGRQFENAYNDLDNILDTNATSVIKDMNAYIGSIWDEKLKEEGISQLSASEKESYKERFIKTLGKTLSETFGYAYSTTVQRMQDIRKSYDDTFFDLEKQYNLTKDSNKFAVIRSNGDFKDRTLGIDDYDYNTTGLLYMKEYEGIDFGSKNGYTLGFSYSHFNFDDAPKNRLDSKEKVLSVRAGVHGERVVNEEHDVRLLSRLEAGYNRHKMRRALNIHKDIRLKGKFNTYTMDFDNRLTKNIYKDFGTKVDIYGLADLELGRISSFTEHGDNYGDPLRLKVKTTDYSSVKLGIGANVNKEIYTAGDIIVKAKADGRYIHELGSTNKTPDVKFVERGAKEGYYSLIESKKERGKAIATFGIGVEKAESMGVNLEMSTEYANRKKDLEVRYGVRLNYTF